MVGAFARGCEAAGIERFALLSAVGSTPKSRFRYVRVMGLKEDAVRKIGFRRLERDELILNRSGIPKSGQF